MGYPHLRANGIDTVQLDLRVAAPIADAARGMDVIFHAAAVTGMWGPHDWFWENNVTATQNVINACKAADVPKLVFTSSPSVVFGHDDLCSIVESAVAQLTVTGCPLPGIAGE